MTCAYNQILILILSQIRKSQNKIPATENFTRVSVALVSSVEHPIFHETRAIWIITFVTLLLQWTVCVMCQVAADENEKEEHIIWNRFQLENCFVCLTACNSMWKMSQTGIKEQSITAEGKVPMIQLIMYDTFCENHFVFVAFHHHTLSYSW